MRLIDADKAIESIKIGKGMLEERTKKYIDCSCVIAPIVEAQTGLPEILFDGIINYLDKCKKVDPVKHGHWIKTRVFQDEDCTVESNDDWKTCSCCNELVVWMPFDFYYDYCGNCGAKMDEVIE